MTDGVRRLTHEDAEMLISARMDEQLDRADSRALLVHLQTCESCRAFAVQSEVLGRELAALPVLPPSAIVDRQIRESIAKGNKRWSLAGLFPAGGGTNGLRTALGALAVLTLVSVFLLVRMATGNNDNGPSIEAPNGGVAQQLDTTATTDLAMAQETTTTVAGPTETARVVAPPVQQTSESETAEPTQAGIQPTTAPAEPTDASMDGNVPPTATLDSAYVYTIDKTKTPTSGPAGETPTEAAAVSTATEESGGVAVAAIGGEEGTPVDATEEPAVPKSPAASETSITPEPSATEVLATATPAEPTEEPATAAPPEPTLAPTMTPTPVEISVDATEEPEPPATETPVEEPSAEAATDEISAEETATQPSEEPTTAPIEPTVTPSNAQSASGGTGESDAETPEPIDTPETPFSQPTIAPISGQPTSGQNGNGGDGGSGADDNGNSNGNNNQGGGQSDDQGDNGSTGAESPPIVPSDGSDVEASGNVGQESGDSPQIVSSGATKVPADESSTESGGDQTTGSGVGGETQPPEPSAIATVDESVEPSGLDLSTTVTTLPPGTSSPLGRLEFSPGMDLYAVTASDGQLAVADLNGELVVTLGPGDLPVWSGNAMMFSAPGDSGAVVGIWDPNSGELSYVPASEDEASSDLPIGGDGSTFYFLRTFPDRPGAMEIHTAGIDGSDQGALWSSDSANLGGARPVWSNSGVLLPTDSSWLLIGADGSESELGANPYGFVGAPVLSPGEGLIAYSAGNQVVVAWSTDPGAAVATADFDEASGSYAFSTSGEEIVISDGASLHVISYDGPDLGTLGGNRPIGGVYWVSDTIYYLQIGEDAALMSTSLDEIQSS